MNNKKISFTYNDISLNFNKGTFITVLGNSNKSILQSLNDKYNSIIYEKLLNNKSNSTVYDCIFKYAKSIKKTKEYLVNYNLIEYEKEIVSKLDINEKIKLEILLQLINKSNIIVIYNILSLLDYNDFKLIMKVLLSIKNKIVINFTNNISESFFGDEILIINDDKLICYGKTLAVLNEEKILKKLGLGLPFIIELNRYLMDYELINKYYLTNEKLVGALWK